MVVVMVVKVMGQSAALRMELRTAEGATIGTVGKGAVGTMLRLRLDVRPLGRTPMGMVSVRRLGMRPVGRRSLGRMLGIRPEGRGLPVKRMLDSGIIVGMSGRPECGRVAGRMPVAPRPDGRGAVDRRLVGAAEFVGTAVREAAELATAVRMELGRTLRALRGRTTALAVGVTLGSPKTIEPMMLISCGMFGKGEYSVV